MKKLFGAALACFILGASLFAAGALMAHGDLSVMDIDTKYVHIRFDPSPDVEVTEYTYPAGDVERIAVDTVSADVRVGYTDGDLVHVIAGSGDDVELSPAGDGTLTVRQKRDTGFKLFNLDFAGGGSDITVLLPSAVSPDLAVSTVSGDVRVDAGTLGDVRLGTTSGDMDVPALTCGDFNVETVSGDTQLGTVTARNVQVSSTSGDVTLGLLDAPDGVSLTSVSGDIEGTLRGTREDYTVRVSTVSGDTRLNDGGPGRIPLKVSTTSGDIDLEFVKR